MKRPIPICQSKIARKNPAHFINGRDFFKTLNLIALINLDITAHFKPMVFDRVEYIEKNIVEALIER